MQVAGDSSELFGVNFFRENLTGRLSPELTIRGGTITANSRGSAHKNMTGASIKSDTNRSCFSEKNI